MLEKSKAAGGAKKPIDLETEAEIRSFVAEYYAMISNVDHNVGILMNWLENKGILDNTIVVFLSDQGDMSGQHGHFCGWKRSACRSAMQIPFLVRYPKQFSDGRRLQSMIDISVDTTPSLLEICGQPIPAGVQGKSFVPAVQDDTPSRDAVMDELMRQSEGGRGQRHPKAECGFRTKDKPILLIDQINDHLEQRNLVDDENYKSVQQELDKRVLQHMTETDDDFDRQMPWPPKNFISHKDADTLLKSDILAQAIAVA